MNRFPSLPTRSCAKIGLAPGLSIQITSATISISGQRISSAIRDNTMSCVRRPNQYSRFVCSTWLRSISVCRCGGGFGVACRSFLTALCSSQRSRLVSMLFSPIPLL